MMNQNRLQATADYVWTSYLYDALGRRVSKADDPYYYDNGELPQENYGEANGCTYWVYDGWNQIAEYSGAYHASGTPPAVTLQKTWLWGTDLSGGLQGAGGVGGLLAASLETGGSLAGVYYPLYDGNGNVCQYLNGSGSAVAKYEYDGFGRTQGGVGTHGYYFMHRFSTKYCDSYTGLYYYGYRDYDPYTGRWLSRDPIGENGGVNLYGFVKNDSLGRVDLLGLTGSHSAETEPEKCCDEKKVEDGRKTLEERYKGEKAQFDKKGVTPAQRRRPEEGGEAQYSCFNLNSGLGFNLALVPDVSKRVWDSWTKEQQDEYKDQQGIPTCWSCNFENRGRPDGRTWYGGKKERDHWVVICSGKDQDGNTIDEATFDLWDPKAVPGQDPDAKGGFREKYPIYYDTMYPELQIQKCSK